MLRFDQSAVGVARRLGVPALRIALGIVFVVFVARPDLTFTGANPLRLTVLGEFVVKNLVLLTAGLAVAGTIPRARPGERLGAMLVERATPGG